MKKNYILPFLLLSAINFSHAQSLKNTLQRLEACKNTSYTDIINFQFSFMEKASTDTLRSYTSYIPSEQQTNGYYRLEGRRQIYNYDGNKLISLYLRDSTYKISKEAIVGQHTRTLLYWTKMIRSFLATPSKIKQLADTSFNNKTYEHVRITISDSIIKGEHVYTIDDLLIDPKTYLPAVIRSSIRGFSDDGAVGGFTEEHVYSNYIFDASGFPDLSYIDVPAYFKLPATKAPPILLAPGTKVPAVILYDLSGNAISFDKLQGKIILVNYTTTGCPHCVNAAQMLTRLHEKYKPENFAIVSIYPFDDNETIVRFDKRFNVHYASYTAQQNIDKEFPYSGFPTFYLVNKDGLVVKSYNGFYKELEEQLTEKINSLEK